MSNAANSNGCYVGCVPPSTTPSTTTTTLAPAIGAPAHSGPLAFTGADITGMALFGASCLAIGGMFISGSRRRRRALGR